MDDDFRLRRDEIAFGLHLIPNAAGAIVVNGTLTVAGAMLTEAILSFLGAGTPPQIPSWGNIMAEGRVLFQVAYYIVLFPGVFLSVTVLAPLTGISVTASSRPRMPDAVATAPHTSRRPRFIFLPR